MKNSYRKKSISNIKKKKESYTDSNDEIASRDSNNELILEEKRYRISKKSNVTTHAPCTDSNNKISSGRRMATPNEKL
ncbi:12351_t:CDS:1, partial [Gigaspora margarita]